MVRTDPSFRLILSLTYALASLSLGKSLDEIFQHWENAVASHEESFYPRNRQGIEARINKLESEKKLSGGNNTSVEPLSETSSKWSKVEVEKLNELWNEGEKPDFFSRCSLRMANT